MNPAVCVSCGTIDPGPVCQCGQSAANAESDHHRCAWVSFGRRCQYPASWSPAIQASNSPWYCSHHGNHEGPAEAETYVEASQDYSPPPAAVREAEHLRRVRAYNQRRAAALRAAHALPASSPDPDPRALLKIGLASIGRPRPGIEWAHRLLARSARGQRVPTTALEFARQALATREPDATAPDAPESMDSAEVQHG